MKSTISHVSLRWAIFLPGILFFAGCMSTAKIQVIEPAAVTLPKEIDTIAVANRFLNNDYNRSNSSYGFPFGDEYAFHKEASDSCVRSLIHLLGKSPRFKDLDLGTELYRTGSDFFAPPMAPASIIELCRAFKSQAIIMLDGFHTNASTSTQMKSRQIPIRTPYVLNGVTYYRTTYQTQYYYIATLQVFYSVGFRLYSGTDGRILDEYRYDNQLTYTHQGSTSSSATMMLPKKNKIIAQIASASGDVYSHRIAPMWTTVKRSYYTSPGKELAQAHQCVNQKNWVEAKTVWEDVYSKATNNRMKIISAYNIALAYEMEDNVESAVEWVNKAKSLCERGSAYEAHCNKYMDALNKRMAVRQKVLDQMDR
ncbi:MAG: DUF6340 family protein [Cytophagaceae bacterium]